MTAHPTPPYPTLPALREAHTRLLEARRENEDAPQFLQHVVEFIARGAATGAYIDDEEERRGVQSLLDFWANVLYRANGLKGMQIDVPDPTLAEFDFSLAPELPDEPCPYRGLEAFRESNSAFFFGREQLVDELVARLEAGERLLALVGSSGSGKSSVVFGGLLPRLKGGIGRDWRYLVMVPGAEPLNNLALIAPVLTPAGDLAQLDLATKARFVFAGEAFRRDSSALAALAEATGAQPVVLVADQFEEVFTLCTDDEARRAFVNQLIGLIRSSAQPHRVILTMRADFVDNVARLPEFKPLFDQAQVDVRAMGIDELRAAIEKPAAKVGLKFDEGIVSNLIETILGEQAGLPLLQFTLLKLWEKRKRNRITKAVYEEVGNPLQALSRSAEAFYTSLIFQNQTTARLILMKMVRPVLEGGREFTSNRIPLSSVFEMGEPKDRVEAVLHRLIFEERLVKLSGVPAADPAVRLSELATQRGPYGEVPQIEVAHEALVRNWPRLAAWLDEARVDLRKRFALTQLAREWQSSGAEPAERDADLLLRGRQLEDAEAYPDLDPVEAAFVQASRAAVQAEERAREAARQREIEQTRALAEAERLRAEEQRRANLRLRRRAWLLVGAAALSIGLALVAIVLAQQAGTNAMQANIASTRAVAQQATAQMEATNAVQAETTAQAAKQLAEENERKAQAAATASFHLKETADAAALTARQEEQRAKTAERAAESGRLAGEAERLLSVSVLDSLRTAIAAITITTAHDEAPLPSAVNALRRTLELPLPRLRLSAGDGPIIAAQFSPDGRWIATAGADGAVRLWDGADGALAIELRGHTSLVSSLQFSPDGDFLLTASDDGTARIWNASPSPELQTGQAITIFSVPGGAINGATFSPDARWVVTAGSDQIARVWDVATGEITVLFEGRHTAAINTAGFSSDGSRIVTASDDGTARVWDATTGLEVGPLLGQEGGVRLKVARFSPDGSQIATGSEDGIVRLWDAATGRLIDELRGHELAIRDIEFAVDGSLITAGDDTTARIWDAQTRKVARVLREHRDTVFAARFSPDGQSALTAGADGAALVWHLQPSVIIADFVGHAAGVNSAYFSADGRRVVTASDDRTARVWALDGAPALSILNPQAPPSADASPTQPDEVAVEGPPVVVNEARFSPDDGRVALVGLNGTAVITSLSSTAPPVRLSSHDGAVLSVAFSPDGARVATAGEDRTARIWDAATGQLLRVLDEHLDKVESVAFSPDGQFTATASDDGTVHVWDQAGRVQQILRGHIGVIWHVAYSPDGMLLVTAGEDGSARVWDAVTGEEKIVLIGHEAGVNGAAFSPDGKLIATAGSDRTVRLWDAATGTLSASVLIHADRVLSVAFSPDGKYLVTASADGTAKVLIYRLEDLLAAALQRVR